MNIYRDETYMEFIGTHEEFNATSLPAKGWIIQDPPLPPIPTVAEVKAAQKNKIAASRFDYETGGITVNGAVIKTDRESQATLTGAWVTVQIFPTILIDWKGANGWVQIDKAIVETLAAAVGTHVQACFTKEKSLCDLVDAAQTVEAVELIVW